MEDPFRRQFFRLFLQFIETVVISGQRIRSRIGLTEHDSPQMRQKFREDDPRFLAHLDDVVDILDDDVALTFEKGLGQGKEPVFADEAQ